MAWEVLKLVLIPAVLAFLVYGSMRIQLNTTGCKTI